MDYSYEEGVTNIKTVKFGYKWTINNFRLNNKTNGEVLVSPNFHMPDKQDVEWCLSLYPKGETEDVNNFISLFLTLTDAINPNINTKVTFSILNSKNEEKGARSFRYIFKETGGQGLVKFIRESILFDSKNDLLPGDKLTIVCKVIAGLEIVENCPKNVEKLKESKSEFSLNSDLQSLFENKNMTDVILAAEGKEFAAHKTILAARSPIFLTMLQTDMQEKRNSRIEFADISIDILGEMMQYLYYGTVKNIKQNACDLVEVADRYDMKGLKLLCEEQFHRELSVNSATKLFILADRHNCNRLKPLILKFIIANAKTIIRTAEFKKFKKDLPILIKEMMHAVV